MATKELVTKVWIEPGCIVCDACETTSPEVFDVQEENCIIRPEALSPDFTKPKTQSIIDAAEECPVDVIKFETAPGAVPDEVAAPAGAASGGVPAPAQPKREEAVAAAAKSPQAPPSARTVPDRASGARTPALASLSRQMLSIPRSGRKAWKPAPCRSHSRRSPVTSRRRRSR